MLLQHKLLYTDFPGKTTKLLCLFNMLKYSWGVTVQESTIIKSHT